MFEEARVWERHAGIVTQKAVIYHVRIAKTSYEILKVLFSKKIKQISSQINF